jgi:methyl-accepting chemotaxis protein
MSDSIPPDRVEAVYRELRRVELKLFKHINALSQSADNIKNLSEEMSATAQELRAAVATIKHRTDMNEHQLAAIREELVQISDSTAAVSGRKAATLASLVVSVVTALLAWLLDRLLL